ncbi:MAG: cadherin-like beta sandwich domain-containing protein [Nitrospirae bacterium]|nr:cadherin-like beta sandwich domain-containing protein [Nitrospirota bacterium]
MTINGNPATSGMPYIVNLDAGGNAITIVVTAQDGTTTKTYTIITRTWFEDNDPAVLYTGAWRTYNCVPCSGGSLSYSDVTGATAEFSFNGTGIKWTVAKDKTFGKARVYLDVFNMGLVDLYSPNRRYPVVLERLGLAPGPHTAVIEVSGQKNARSTGYYIDIDAFEVIP